MSERGRAPIAADGEGVASRMGTQTRKLLRSVVPKIRPLSFKCPELERRFEAYHLATSLVPARLALLTGAALYALVGALDAQFAPRAMLAVWTFRLVVIACAILALIATYGSMTYAALQRLLAGTAVLAITGIAAMMALAPPPNDRLYFEGMLLAVIYVFVMLQLRVSKACLITALQLLLIISATLCAPGAPSLAPANAVAIFLGFVITGMVAGHLLEYNKRRAFLRTQSARRRATSLSDRLMDVEQRRRDAEESSIRDPLTGMYNRRHFLRVAERELGLPAAGRGPLALVMLDVDHFKAVNDTHGHPVGDQVLRNVARVIGEHIRPRDVACRYGGEEFAILLLDTNEHMARAVSRRLHQAIRSAAVLIGTTEVSVSVSIGFAIAAPDAEPDLDGLVKRADLALYVAKQGGRDQVKTWNLDAAARHQARGERG